ncbi:hypothetical protein LTR36_002488 [Oleoguttula mirabilis]|uniref:YTH domain-containing protein n=1 Tax=Oleoguttula mirabilis TaxID=1507867 RepID=A0AAV9JKF1_9PEZI|nr:hypothetical protein LTR36_002488 [Oleoguttula mirabilis]
MDPTAGEFRPGRGNRPQPINTSLPAAPFLSSNTRFSEATQSAPGLGLGLDFGSSKTTATAPNQAMKTGDYLLPARSGALPTANTYPLAQHPFGGARDGGSQPRFLPPHTQHQNLNLNTQASQGFSHGTQSATSQSFSDNYTTNTSSEDGNSQLSTISPHYLLLHPEQAAMKPQIFEQASHPRSFRRIAMDPKVDVQEAYMGAYNLVHSLNPDYFTMPYGTRVINIKTDYPSNIYYAAQTGSWSTLEKVSQRIMTVWDARQDAGEKVLFLFAVNGSKQYCGLAEMSGPWDPSGHIDGWAEKTSGAGSVGTIPLTWLFIKNVGYDKFQGVSQERKDQPIINMWNGMHFDTEVGRRVLQIYVTQPHCDNILAFPRRGPQNRPQRIANHNRQGTQNQQKGYNQGNHHVVANVRAIKGGRGGQGEQNGQNGRGGYTGAHRNMNTALASDDWRGSQNQWPGAGRVLGEVSENEPTPTASRQQGVSVNTNAPPPHFDGPAETASGPRVGQVVSCVVDEHGNLVPISPLPQQTNTFTYMPSQESFRNDPVELSSLQNPRSQTYHRGDFRGGARGGMRGDMRGARSPNASGVRGPHPADHGNAHMHGSHDFEHPLHQAASAATIGPQHANIAATLSAPMLHHAASTATFVPQSQHNHMLRNAASNAGFMQYGQSGLQYGSAHRNQPPPYAKPTPPSDFSSGYTPVSMRNDIVHWEKKPKPSIANESEDSYVRAFGEHDSMAGFNYKMPPPKAQQTPTHAPGTKQGLLQQTMKLWDDKTPTQKNFAYPPPVDGDGIPRDKRPSYFRLMAHKSVVEKKLANLGGEDDETVYYDLMANKSELEVQLDKLTMDDSYSNFHSDGSPCKRGARGSSEADSTVYETSSIERHNISPLRAKDGRALHSVSKHGSPKPKITRKGNRARNAPYSESFDARLTANIYGLVDSPTSSARVNYHSSPPAKSVTAETVASEVTNPYSDHQSEGDGSGGCRLES